MPVEFLSDERVAAYGAFPRVVPTVEVERSFYLDEADRELVALRRSDSHRLGFALQLGTVRALGRFLEDPLDVPWAAVAFLAEQLGVADPSCVKGYATRVKTPYEHAWEITGGYGYHAFDNPAAAAEFGAFLDGRAWTQAEGPVALFDLAVQWLRRRRVLLPGVTVLARAVASARERAEMRLHALLATAVGASDDGLPGRLRQLLVVPEGSRVSGLELLRQSPRRTSGPAMVQALQRAENLAGLRTGRVLIDEVPANRMKMLARVGLGTKASALARLNGPRQTATLLAVVRHLEATAIDDALDLFSLLMATRLFSPARRVSVAQRLAALPRLEKASRTVARAGRLLLDALAAAEATNQPLDAVAVWVELERVAPRAVLNEAIVVVEELVPEDDGTAAAAMRVALTARYATVRPFLTLLGETGALHAAPGGERVLAAVRCLPELARRRPSQRPLGPEDIDVSLVTPAWQRVVFGDGTSAGPAMAGPAALGSPIPAVTVKRDAYAVCVLEQLHRALAQRDVFARPSHRYGDPRAQLLDGEQWEAVREEVLSGLSLAEAAPEHLARQVRALDTAWRDTAARLGDAGSDARVRVTSGDGGRARLEVDHLDALGEPASLVELRRLAQAMMPRVDLPELLLEVHGWTGFLHSYTHLTGTASRAADLPVSVAALLVAEACNIGLTPVTKAGDPALSRARLAHVDHNYVRAENHAAANAVLIDTQARIPIASCWGGGLLASVDGLRFVVPVATLNAGPSPKYFGYKRGITWLNAVNDQVAGIGQMVVPGTPRDSLHILDTLLNLDAGPKPDIVATDNASYSDMVFGVFFMLGYQFSPRFADLADQRYWRAPLPGGQPGDYGPLDAVASNTINLGRISAQWPDMQRVAGSLVTNQVRAYDLLRMFGRDGHPTPLGQGFAEYGRIAKTLHLLAIADPVDDSYQRRMNRQLTVQESRHALARAICHGNRGQIRQAYREGQEDQLAALGLVLNAVVLWNTRYLDAIITELRARGHTIKDADVARLSPLIRAHLNCLGRYAFPTLDVTALRPLRDPEAPDDQDDGGAVRRQVARPV